MFGYVRPLVPELKVREYELYRGVYCGLCRAMGRHTTCISPFTLSYDFVFLALVRLAVCGESPQLCGKRCIAHPLKKRPTVQPLPSLVFSAGANALLTYHKIADDIADSRGLRSLAPRLLYPAAAVIRRKALKNDGDLSPLDGAISEKLAHLSSLEQNQGGADECAEMFGELLGEAFAHGFDAADRRISYEIGRGVGRWIYLVDAADDFASDSANGEFNTIAAGGRSPDDTLRDALKMELVRVGRAAELITFSDAGVEGLVKNIIYLGMPAAADAVLAKSDN